MIIAVLNHKGGTGKTTVAVNLAAELARRDRRILLVDLDCQGSATRSLGAVGGDDAPGAADVLLRGLPTEEAIVQTRVPHLDLLPGGIELAHSDLVLADVEGREDRLTIALARVRKDYDLILCDCGPSLSMLPINALLAADGYLVPLVPEPLAVEGLESLMGAVRQLEAGMGVSLDLLGVVFTMVRAGLFADWTREAKDQKRVMDQVRARYGGDLFESIIRRDPAVARAPARGVPVAQEAGAASAIQDFAGLADALLARAAATKIEHERSVVGEEDA